MVPDHKDVLFVVHFDCRPADLRLMLSSSISGKQIIVMVIIHYIQGCMKYAHYRSALGGEQRLIIHQFSQSTSVSVLFSLLG